MLRLALLWSLSGTNQSKFTCHDHELHLLQLLEQIFLCLVACLILYISFEPTKSVGTSLPSILFTFIFFVFIWLSVMTSIRGGEWNSAHTSTRRNALVKEIIWRSSRFSLRVPQPSSFKTPVGMTVMRMYIVHVDLGLSVSRGKSVEVYGQFFRSNTTKNEGVRFADRMELIY